MDMAERRRVQRVILAKRTVMPGGCWRGRWCIQGGVYLTLWECKRIAVRRLVAVAWGLMDDLASKCNVRVSCNDGLCYNPKHLEILTPAEKGLALMINNWLRVNTGRGRWPRKHELQSILRILRASSPPSIRTTSGQEPPPSKPTATPCVSAN